MNFLEYSGLIFWVLVFIVFVGYIIARVYGDLYGGQVLSVDELVLLPGEYWADAAIANRPHVRAGVYQQGSES